MAFFRNRSVNLLNLHYGLHALALAGGEAFYVAYLIKVGLPVPLVLTLLAAMLVIRFVVRPLILPLGKRFGVQPLVIAGTLINALQYPILAEVQGTDWRIIPLSLVGAVGGTLYWTSYHAFFAALGDSEHRGHQVSAREAVAAAAGVASPLVTGLFLATLGPHVAFGATALMLVVSAAPLLFAANVPVLAEAPGVVKSSWRAVVMMACDGWGASGHYVFQIALFLSLGSSFTAYGGAVAAAALIGAASGMVLGRWIDLGHGTRVVWLAAGLWALTWVLKAAGYADPVLAVAANAFGAFAGVVYGSTVGPAIYNQAAESPCVLRFNIATEGGFDAGGAVGCLTAAALIQLGAPLWAGILLPLISLSVMQLMLRRYYGGLAAAAT